MGRPGLDPGTLGLLIPSPSHSIEVRLFWSELSDRPPHSAEDLRGLLLRLQYWLQYWLQEQVGDVSGSVRYVTPDHETIHIQWP